MINPRLLLPVKLNQVSLKSLLKYRLLEILSQSEIEQRLKQQGQPLSVHSLPLYRSKDFAQCTYRCSLALVIGKRLSTSSQEIAAQIWRKLGEYHPNEEETDHLVFYTQLVTPGWFEFQVRDPIPWLEFVLHHPPQGSPYLAPQTPSFFLAQYAHARCCSLLRRAAAQQLVVYPSPAQLPESPPLPHLTSEQKGELTRDFPDARERQLLMTLMMVIDESDNLSFEEAIQKTKALSQALLEFYDHCRIWGEVQHTQPQRVQTRLALLAGIQIWLRWLLATKVGVVAPVEL